MENRILVHNNREMGSSVDHQQEVPYIDDEGNYEGNEDPNSPIIFTATSLFNKSTAEMILGVSPSTTIVNQNPDWCIDMLNELCFLDSGVRKVNSTSPKQAFDDDQGDDSTTSAQSEQSREAATNIVDMISDLILGPVVIKEDYLEEGNPDCDDSVDDSSQNLEEPLGPARQRKVSFQLDGVPDSRESSTDSADAEDEHYQAVQTSEFLLGEAILEADIRDQQNQEVKEGVDGDRSFSSGGSRNRHSSERDNTDPEIELNPIGSDDTKKSSAEEDASDAAGGEKFDQSHKSVDTANLDDPAAEFDLDFDDKEDVGDTNEYDEELDDYDEGAILDEAAILDEGATAEEDWAESFGAGNTTTEDEAVQTFDDSRSEEREIKAESSSFDSLFEEDEAKPSFHQGETLEVSRTIASETFNDLSSVRPTAGLEDGASTGRPEDEITEDTAELGFQSSPRSSVADDWLKQDIEKEEWPLEEFSRSKWQSSQFVIDRWGSGETESALWPWEEDSNVGNELSQVSWPSEDGDRSDFVARNEENTINLESSDSRNSEASYVDQRGENQMSSSVQPEASRDLWQDFSEPSPFRGNKFEFDSQKMKNMPSSYGELDRTTTTADDSAILSEPFPLWGDSNRADDDYDSFYE